MHLIVHIGPHKTGTSSIQAALRSNEELLAQFGVAVFSVGAGQIRELSLPYSRVREITHPSVMNVFGTPENALRNSEDRWRYFEKSVRDNRYPTSIISSEHFSSLAKPAIFFSRLRAMFELITVVCYARDPISLYTSSLQEQILNRGFGEHTATIYDYRVRYQKFLEYSSAAVGAENIIIRNFARDNLVNGDVVADFFSIVGRFVKLPYISKVLERESIPGAALAWLVREDEIRGSPMPFQQRQRFSRLLRRDIDFCKLPKLAFKDPDWSRVVRHNNRCTYEWLDSTFLNDQIPILNETWMSKPLNSRPSNILSEMRRWIMEYLDLDAENLITNAISVSR